MRFCLFSALFFFFAVCSCWGQTDDHAEAASSTDSIRKPAASKIRSVDELIRQKLNEPCEWDFDQTPWREIEKYLEKNHGINIVLTSSAKDDSLTEDEPVTENLTGVATKNALRIMLQKKNATYIVKNGVVMIISLDDAEDERYFSTVFINVRPLLASIETLEKGRIGKPRIPPHNRNTKAVTSVQGNPVELVTAESLLIDLIHSAYQPTGWQRTGQGLATINILGGFAVVNCTEEFTDGLRDFLGDLEYHLSQD